MDGPSLNVNFRPRRLGVAPLAWLSQPRLRFAFLSLLISVMVSGCGNLTSSIRRLVGLQKDEITGSVPAFSTSGALSASSSEVGRFCSDAKINLYRLTSTGSLQQQPLQTVELSGDGSYAFRNVKSLGIDPSRIGSSTDERLLVEAVGCGASHRRLITGVANQNVTFGSSLVSYLLSTSESSRLATAEKDKLARLLIRLESYRDFASAYANLSSTPELKQLFEDIFGTSPEILRDAAPRPLEIRVPPKAREGEATTLAVSAQQWRPDYPFAYQWVIDGAVVGRGNNVNYVPDANSQGLKTLNLYIGQADASGAIDQTKPFVSKSFTLEVENTIPPVAPPIAVVGSSHINTQTVNLRLATGISRAACESFSSLAITENEASAPFREADFNLTCSTGPSQDLTYSLQTGVGTKTLRLWARDAAGTVSTSPSVVTVIYSLVMPNLTITSPASGTRVQSTVLLSGTCEANAGDVTITGGSTSQTVACSSGTFSSLVSLSGADGNRTLQAAQTNAFGNTGSATVSVIKDTTGPSVLLSTAAANPTSAATFSVNVLFSEPVIGFDLSKINSTQATVSNLVGSGTTYSFDVSPTAEGMVSVSIAAAQVTDLVGNPNVASPVLTRIFDSVRPSATLSSTAPNPTRVSPIPVTLVFSEPVTGLSLAGIEVTNGTASTLTGSGTNYSFVVTPSSQGSISVRVLPNAAQDAATNPNTASTALVRVFDDVRPTVTLSSTAADPTNASPIPISVSFSESVTGFTLASVSVTNGSASSLSGTGSTYTFNVTPAGNGTVSVQINSGAAQDAATNQSLASTTLSRVFSNVRPMVTLSTTAASPTNQSPFSITASFSATVTGFEQSDISVSNGTVTTLTGSGALYTFSVSPSGQGDVTISVPADSAIDNATNGNQASNPLVITYDTVAPTLAFTSPPAASFINLANQSAFAVGGSCSENGRSVAVQIGTASATATCSTGSFSATLDLGSIASGAVSASATMSDAAGNAATPATLALTKDTSRPTAVLAGTPNSPSRTTQLDVTVGGSGVVSYRMKVGAAAAINCSDASGYSASVNISTKIANSVSAQPDGSLRLCVLGQNAAGNEQDLASATDFSWIKDTTAVPFGSLAVTPTSPGNDSKPTVSGTTEGLAVVELYALPACAGSKVGDATALANGAFSVAPVSSLGADGVYSLSALMTDLAGNTLCSSSVAYTLDTTAPSVTLASTAPSPTNASPIPVTVTFAENVTGFTASDLTVVNGTVSAFVGSGANYSFNLSPSGQGTFSVSVAAGSAIDAAQNQNLASNILSRIYDTVAPALTIASPAVSAATNQSSITFSGACENGFPIQLSGGGLASPSSATCTSGSYSVSVTLTAGEGAKAITLSQTDAAGNIASVSRTVTFDTTAPVLTQTALAATSYSNTNTVTFGGACETGVSVVVSGTDSSSATCSAGAWTYTTASRNTDASRSYTFTQTDAAGNASSVNATWIRDTIAPALVWSSPANNSTAQTQITATGTCEVGFDITFAGSGISSGATLACPSGTFSQVLTLTSGEGSKTITASQTDLASNTTTITRTIVRDNTPPVLTQTARAATSYSNTNTVTFGGACETGVSVVVSGTDSSSAACSAGAWTYTTATQSTDASRSYTFTQTDAAGNAASVSATWIRDTVAPTLVWSSPANNSTAQTQITATGTCEAGLNVNFSGTGITSGTAATCTSGTFSQLLALTSGEGAKAISASQTDLASNTTTVNLTIVRDNTAPALTQTARTATSHSNSNSVTFGGACETGLSVVVSGTDSSSTTCSAGAWTYTTATQTTDASRTYTFTQTDAAGNAASVSATWIRDTVAPALTIASPSVNAATNQSSITFSGACETGLPIQLSGAGLVSPSSATCTSGSYSFSVTLTSGEGAKAINLSQTDAAGNIASVSRTLTFDTTAPVITQVDRASPSTTNTVTVSFGGACESGLNVVVSGAESNSAVCSSGLWSYATNLQFTDGTRTYTFTQTDAAGNAASVSATWIRDTVAPALTIASPAVNASTNQSSITFSGACENGFPIQLSGGGLASPSSATCTSGSYSVSVTLTAGEGAKAITLSQTDAAGNIASVSRTVTFDTTAPVLTQTALAATSYSNTNTVTFGGACETGVNVIVSGTDSSSATCSAGAWTYTTASRNTDASHSYTFTQTDAAGNASSVNATWIRDTVAPTLVWSSPANNSTAQSQITAIGTCEVGFDITFAGSGISSGATLACPSGTFSQVLTLTSGEGSKTITASQTDLASNTTTITRTIVRDNTPPVLTQTARAATSYSNTNTVTFGGACETGVNVVVSSTDSSSAACSAGTWTYTTAAQTTDTSRSYTFTQTDAAGNATSVNALWIRDTVAPTPLSWSTPADGTPAQDQISVSGTCEAGLGLVFTGSGLLSQINSTCAGGTFSRTLFFSAGDGSKTITIRQTDLAGNISEANRSFTRDTTPPAISQTTANSPLTSTASSVTFGGACETGLAISIAYSGASAGTSTTTCPSGTWSWTSPSEATDGARIYTFTQVDLAGNSNFASAQWTRDTVAPFMAFTSQSSWLTASDAVTFTGSCESGLSITVAGGTDSGSAVCSSGQFSYTTVTRTTDATRTYTFTQTDAAGNATTLTGTWQRVTSGPVLTVTSSDRIINSSGSATFSGACQSGLSINVTGATTTTLTCSSGSWSYSPTASTDGSRTYTLTQTNAVPISTTVTLTWIRDTTAPTISTLTLSGGIGTVNTPVAKVSLNASDTLTRVTHFCLRLDATAPLISDGCWTNVASNPPGLIPALTLNLTNFDHPLGLIPANYTVYSWVRDEAGNISAHTAQNGVDQATVSYSPGSDPVITFTWVTGTDNPSSPPSKSDQTIAAGQLAYVKWRVTDPDVSGLAANPVTLRATYDGNTWVTLAANLPNSANGSCVPDGPSTLDDGATGCAVIDMPTSDYVQIELRATDAVGRQAQRLSNPLNTGALSFVAGNLDRGFNSSATSAVFPYVESAQVDNTESGTFVVTESNDVYIADARSGLLQIKGSDGILRRLIPATGTTTTGSVTSATLNFPLKVALEHTGNLLILDYDRILRFDLVTQTITHIIGGGSNAGTLITNPLDIQFTPVAKSNSLGTMAESHHRHTLIPLPDGRIVFWPRHTTGTARTIAVYDPNGNPHKIRVFTPDGTTKSGGGTANLSDCLFWGLSAVYDPATSVVSRYLASIRSPVSGVCSGTTENGTTYLDPETFLATATPTPVMPSGQASSLSWQSRLITGNDGKSYMARRTVGSIWRYDIGSNSFTRIVGNGTMGACADGTAAASCPTEVRDLWVSRTGRVFWWERSRLRSVNDSGQVITLYGQSLSFGDGGSPLLARFSNLSNLDRTDSDELVVGDMQEFTFRTINAARTTIQRIAGTALNAGFPTNNSNALTSSAPMYGVRPYFVLNRTNGEIITSGSANLVRLNRSTGIWQTFGLHLHGGTIYTSADGSDGASIRMGENEGAGTTNHVIPIAWTPTGLLTINQRRLVSSARVDVMFKFYDHSTRTQSHVYGAIGSAAATMCQPTAATPLSATVCTYPGSDSSTNALRPVWDSIGNRWIIGQQLRNFVIAANGTDVTLVATLPRAYISMTYYRDASNRFLIYCGANEGRLYKYDLNASSNQETQIQWTLPNTRCTGLDLIYDPSRKVVYSPVTRDSLSGLIEAVVP